MSNELEYNVLERIAVALEGILSELRIINGKNSEKKLDSVKMPIITSEPQMIKSTKIQRFLDSKGFEFLGTREIEDIKTDFIKIANIIGNSYLLVEKFIKEIKRNLAGAKKFTLYMRDYSDDEKCAICGLATTLKEHKFLKEYFYKKSPHFLLTAKPDNSPELHNFYTGQWLEIYAANIVRTLFSGRHGTRSVNLNTKVKTNDGSDFEFDVIGILGDEVFWVECKTGDYKKYIIKYEKIARELGLDTLRVFLVIAGIDDVTVKALNDEHNITICNVENFRSVFENSLNKIAINE